MQEKTRRLIERTALTIFVFSLLGGLYIVGNGWFHPETLTWRLTHYASWPREDNFGVFCFIVSFFSFLIWNLTRK
jgi:hypothetical protein